MAAPFPGVEQGPSPLPPRPFPGVEQGPSPLPPRPSPGLDAPGWRRSCAAPLPHVPTCSLTADWPPFCVPHVRLDPGGFAARLLLARSLGCSLLTFDHRDVGASSGTLHAASDLVEDAASEGAAILG
eukprot:2050112-Prymnesium_polylepis.1